MKNVRFLHSSSDHDFDLKSFINVDLFCFILLFVKVKQVEQSRNQWNDLRLSEISRLLRKVHYFWPSITRNMAFMDSCHSWHLTNSLLFIFVSEMAVINKHARAPTKGVDELKIINTTQMRSRTTTWEQYNFYKNLRRSWNLWKLT